MEKKEIIIWVKSPKFPPKIITIGGLDPKAPLTSKFQSIQMVFKTEVRLLSS